MTINSVSRIDLPPGRAEAMFPVLTEAQVARIARHGRSRATMPDDVLVRVGDSRAPFFVVTRGLLRDHASSRRRRRLIVEHRAGEFTGETNMLSGRPSLVRIAGLRPAR